MDEAIVPKVDTDVGKRSLGVIENQIARLKVARADRSSYAALRPGIVRQTNAVGLLENVRDQTAAVKTRSGRLAATVIRDPCGGKRLDYRLWSLGGPRLRPRWSAGTPRKYQSAEKQAVAQHDSSNLRPCRWRCKGRRKLGWHVLSRKYPGIAAEAYSAPTDPCRLTRPWMKIEATR